MATNLTYKADIIGASASLLCMIHCLATPFLFFIKSSASLCCSETPVWWKSLDYLFLTVGFFAVVHITRNNITKNLRCLVCQGQSIYDSDSEFANSLKILVDRKIDEGLTDAEIYEYFKNKYGEWILYDPKLNKNTYILWFMPLLIFLLGGAIIFKKFIKKEK